MSFLLVALLLFLLFGGSRISAVGKGLGEAVRHVKRAVADGKAPPAEQPTQPPMITASAPEPKLLPAKGESSASSEGEDA